MLAILSRYKDSMVGRDVKGETDVFLVANQLAVEELIYAPK